MLEALDPTLLVWPFVAAVVVLITHVPLGREVLARGIVFLDLAIAQVAALGILAARLGGWDTTGWRMQVSALAAALLAAALVRGIEKHWPNIQEPLIGTLFVFSASLASLLAALDPHGGEHLHDLLAGQLLWVSAEQVGLAALISLLALLIWRFGQSGRFGRGAFYLAFALCITQSVQLVGVYMVFACLIFPALAARGLPVRPALLGGLGIGLTGSAVGLMLSTLFDLPSGPLVVLTLGISAVLAGGILSIRHHSGPPMA